MTLSILHRPALRAAVAALLASFCVLALHLLLEGDDGPARLPAVAGGPTRPAANTDAEIRRLQHAVRGGAPLDAQLAGAYLQKVRETGDPGYYIRADAVLRRALARGPADPAELVEAATLAAGRHDFRAALRLAERARALQRLVDLRPALPAYARVSYFRELHGDLAGAAAVMARSVAAGGAVPENVAYVQALLGDLERARGRTAAARRAYRAALIAVPGYAPAAAGRARLAAATGDLRGAIARWRRIVARLPLPEYVIALGETELAAGRRAAGLRDLALVRAERDLLARAGVNTDVELAGYEAQYGDRRRAVALAQAAWENAPSVRSADALGWALIRAGRPRAGVLWAHRALRLGSLDPAFRYHAGMAALAAGRRAEGRRELRLALAHGLDAQPLQARRAREALR